MTVPPGFVWIAQNAPRFLLPPTLTYAALHILSQQHRLALPHWLDVVACALSLPGAFVIAVLYTKFRDTRAAAARGAVLAPMVPSRLPGSIDKVTQLARNFEVGYISDVQRRDAETVGNTMSTPVLWQNRIQTSEPEYVKAILATQFKSFEKGPVLFEQFKSLFGIGVFNSDGDMWKFHRTMTRPFFNKDRISHFDAVDRHAEDALGQTKARLREGLPIDFQDMVHRFTLDSATEFLFGKDVRSLSAGLIYPPNSPLAVTSTAKNHPANVFADAFMESQIATGQRFFWAGAWRLREFWTDKVAQKSAIVNQFFEPVVEAALERKRERQAKGLDQGQDKAEVDEEDTLLDHLVKVTDDKKLIRDELFNIMLAGRDTTACTLTMSVYMLSQHPDILRRLREEVLTKVGPSSRPTTESIRDMKYMRAFINEVLRLYPPVPNNSRATGSKGTVLPGINGQPPIYVPPNTTAGYSVFLMQRRKDFWGPDAELFDPDRFIDERLRKYLTPNPFIFTPFNAGPRICLGQQFAYNETSYFLVKLLQAFSTIELAGDVQPKPPAEWSEAKGRQAMEKVMIKIHLTMYIHGGLWVRMGEAKDVEEA
ncbi:cytochrome P450 [Coniophora puteana RWD-64-598 SS2]|uniref:Cytochrome P450 n=1 Tax=Coniophora puteana (strain RWD-64-598) TaxID=741705 RepID=A0A5M3MS70_CONPW|nr:cytochrome P450 [Coniophora puteana RWD-64-598 SS2]EIW81950.1 cytochrome P450 [Coniophora puteana RWD-64-598 SS2]